MGLVAAPVAELVFALAAGADRAFDATEAAVAAADFDTFLGADTRIGMGGTSGLLESVADCSTPTASLAGCVNEA